ncbi:DUF6185 family protein [Streptomyces sp. DSM 41524]|uniref:DUF6185 family protein n=1 Tax=Streptomyces asiaticus subsp. ignotus TaxID=3098222 RepID=A0ABU7Q2C2_9ACTN|nr:DUF6185 family protein [Streptomyces sp. DSM 41524]
MALLLGVFVVPERAHASDDICRSERLTGGSASASIRLDDDRTTQTKILSRLTVHVPAQWPYATWLLLGEDSEKYRRAMSCLMKGPDSQFQWWDEWRSHRPAVTAEKSGVKVRVDTYAWADDEGVTWVGPWNVEIGKDYWTVRLSPAAALRHVRWSSIVVDPGSSSAISADPGPMTGKGDNGLVWRQKPGRTMPAVKVRVDPSWQRSWAAQHDRLRFLVPDSVSWVLWDWCLAAMLLLAAHKTRRAGSLSPDETGRVATATRWAWVSVALSLLCSGDNVFYRVLQRHLRDGEWTDRQAHHGLLVNLAVGWLLLVFGRPRKPTIWLAGVVLTLPGLAVALRPEHFGLTEHTFLAEDAPDKAVFALFTATGSVFALVLMGWAATGWRLACSTGLIRPSRPKAPGRPAGPRELSLRWTAPLVVFMVAVIGLCAANVSERAWQRASWLSAHSDVRYGVDHVQALRNDLTWFAVNSQDWLYGYTYLLSALAILAVIRARALRPSAASALHPDPVDMSWMLVLFPVAVGLSLGVYVGNGALGGLWFLVNLGAFGLSVALCKGRSVLERPLQRSGEALGTAIAASHRNELLDRARRFREIHAKLRRLDQGQSDDEALNRRGYERELRGLHRWRDSHGAADKLPFDVSVVDAALVLGPHDTWWENGRRAAQLAAFIGIPASALLVWAEHLRGEFLTSDLYSLFGPPGILMGFVYWEVTWAGAGFLLGALWRRLPGSRGPVKSLPIAAAFALPIGIDAIGNWFTRESQTNLALYAVAMLLVLTVTGIVLDLETFRGERRYWQSRLGLLLSVYQMRYFSLQMAYLLAQLIAMFTLWQFFADAGGPPAKGADTPVSGSSGS